MIVGSSNIVAWNALRSVPPVPNVTLLGTSKNPCYEKIRIIEFCQESECPMIKESLFGAEEREAKLDRLGDVLQVMEQHVDFKALAAEVDRVAPRPGREYGGRPAFPTELMVRAWILQNL